MMHTRAFGCVHTQSVSHLLGHTFVQYASIHTRVTITATLETPCWRFISHLHARLQKTGLSSVFVHHKYAAYSRTSIHSHSGRSTHSVNSRIVNMRLTLIAALLFAVTAEDGSVQMDGAPDPHIDWVHIATCRSHCFHNVSYLLHFFSNINVPIYS